MPLLAATLALGGAAIPVAASAQAVGWSVSSLDIVGGPTPSGQDVVVLDVTSSHALQLTALSATTGHVLWSKPSSPSEITLGVAYSPVVVGGIVLNLAPVGGSSNADVAIEGIAVSTGRLAWTVPGTGLVTDAPVVCGTGTKFCVAAANGSTTSLLIIDAVSGALLKTVAGPERAISTAPQGSPPRDILWQTGASTPKLLQLSTSDQVLWSRTLSGVLGGSQYNPNYGWDFATEHGLDVGTMGYGPTGNRLPLGNYSTVGIAVTTGNVEWSVPGAYECSGALQSLTTDVVCELSGSIVEASPTNETAPGLGLVLKGLNAVSGRTTWAFRVGDVKALVLEDKVSFLDGDHLAVESPAGKWLVLDVVNGATQPVGAHQEFWCQQVSDYSITVPKASAGTRVAQPSFAGCNAEGEPSAAIPSTRPGDVGVTVAGLFIWSGPHGLRAVPAF
jgi:hypothetical protein